MINNLDNTDKNLIERYAFLIKDRDAELNFTTVEEFEAFLLREFNSSEKGRIQFLLTNIIPNLEEEFKNDLLNEIGLSEKQFFVNC